MTALFSALAPILASTDWPEIIQGGGTAAVIALLIYILKLVKDGTFRLDREVAAEKEGRLAAEARAQKAEDKLALLQDAMMNDFSPALLRNSTAGEKVVESATRLAQTTEKLIDAFLRRLNQ